MKRFDDQNIKEKIDTLTEDDIPIDLSWDYKLGKKFLILLPLILYLLCFLFNKTNFSFIELLSLFLTAIILIFVGTILYLRMLR
tara:strand:+ start:2477 stop:2728 length:252 start_codon:yes stop_codon:yes gene_type:complete